MGRPEPHTGVGLDESLEHFGVKGMRWGVRREDIKTHAAILPDVKTKSGQTLRFKPDKIPGITRLISRMSSRFREKVNNSDGYSLQDSSGKKIGEMSLFKESPTSLNIVWVGVNSDARGRGYATAAMKSAINSARKQKLKTVTLEVPGNSPDARHVYEKLGFKKSGELIGDTQDIWGGLTPMTLNLTTASVKHEETVEDILAHFGIKGMRWGVRRTNPSGAPQASEDAKRADMIKTTARKGGTKVLSNKDLQDAITRMNLERQYKALSPNKKQQVLQFVGKTLLGIGKQEATKLAGEIAAKQIANLLKK